MKPEAKLRFEELNIYIRRWIGCLRMADTAGVIEDLDSWIDGSACAC